MQANSVDPGIKILKESRTLADKVADKLAADTKRQGIVPATLQALKSNVPMATILKNLAMNTTNHENKADRLAAIFNSLFNAPDEGKAVESVSKFVMSLYENKVSGLAKTAAAERVIADNFLSKLAAINPKFAEILKSPDGYKKVGLDNFSQAQIALRNGKAKPETQKTLATSTQKESQVYQGRGLIASQFQPTGKSEKAAGGFGATATAEEVLIENGIKLAKMLLDNASQLSLKNDLIPNAEFLKKLVA